MAKPDPALLDPARYPHARDVATRYADLDPNRHVNNIAMAALFEDSRARLVHELDSGWIGSLAVMIVNFTIDYLGQAHYPAPLTLHSAVIAVGRTSMTLLQLARQEGRAVAIATTVVVLTDGERPVPIPDHWRPAMAALELRS
ncbi:acyl-CoA thioesterase [Novosphingobium flavum]|uniref:Acyl-CoA thioesterase n=1 Tax=Novosphingobium flavum TaxID=1778672 RepID=A0A7X1FPH4_9SPHN|nr:thioesterase family protein [Novosphingobium flavum]MBC2664561.1 acyl-CoA thioesterase [Novosphingobium flavum]